MLMENIFQIWKFGNLARALTRSLFLTHTLTAQALALLDDAETPGGVKAELDTSKEMSSLLKKITQSETVMEKDAEQDQYAEGGGERMSSDAEQEQQERE